MTFLLPPFFVATRLRAGAGASCIPAVRWLALALLAVPGVAAERDLTIAAPATVATGGEVTVSITAATHLGGGEQIGFFHGEYSVDGGRTWTGFCYDQNQGAAMTRVAGIRAGGPGSRIVVRVRVAFRDGAAGDVDFTGAAIRWTDTWKDWREPPAKTAVITVVAR